MKFEHWDFINMSSDSWSDINCRTSVFEGGRSNSLQWARTFSFTRFLDHTQRCTTVGRTPLDEWSARCRDLYLTTHNRQTSMPPVGFEPTFSAGEWPQTYILDRTTNGSGPEPYNAPKQWQMCDVKLRLLIQVFLGCDAVSQGLCFLMLWRLCVCLKLQIMLGPLNPRSWMHCVPLKSHEILIP